MWQLRMYCNLRSPDVTLVLFRFNYYAHAKLKVAEPIAVSINQST